MAFGFCVPGVRQGRHYIYQNHGTTGKECTISGLEGRSRSALDVCMVMVGIKVPGIVCSLNRSRSAYPLDLMAIVPELSALERIAIELLGAWLFLRRLLHKFH